MPYVSEVRQAGPVGIEIEHPVGAPLGLAIRGPFAGEGVPLVECGDPDEPVPVAALLTRGRA